MQITELYIRGFGKFTEKHFYFRNGLQIIYGENGYGKSTIHAFVRAMLFGMERGRGRAAGKDDFSRYQPWETPERYGGVMWFLVGGRRFRLERRFGRQERTASLICEDDGEELSVEQGDLDMLLGGMTASVFDNTISIGQLRAEPGIFLAESLEQYASNCCASGDEAYDLKGAFDHLKERIRETERKKKQKELLRARKIESLEQECAYLEKEMEQLQEEFRMLETNWKGERQEQGQQAETMDHPPLTGGFGKKGAVAFLVGCAGLLWTHLPGVGELVPGVKVVSLLSVAFLLLGVVLVIAGWRERRKDVPEKGTDTQRQDTDASQRFQWERERIQKEWKERKLRLENCREQVEEIGPDEEEQELQKELEGIFLAQETLKETARKMGKRISLQFCRRASELFSEITGGKYRSVFVEEGFRITVWDGVRRIPSDRLSRGTLEQLYFAVRMAAAEQLVEEPVPIFLDDTFVFYDDDRLRSVLEWLERQNRQVFLFTCQQRERKQYED